MVGLFLGVASLGAAFVACAEGVEKKDFGDDFSANDGGRREASTATDGAPIPVDDGAVPESDAVAPSDAAKPDAPTAADAADADSCTGSLAVLAGDDTSLKAALKTRGAWATQTLTGESAISGPSLVAFGTGFQGAFRASGDALKLVTATTGTFGVPARLGTSSTRGTPALATNGTAMHLLFQDTTFLHMHSTWTGTTFDTPADLGATSFGAEPLAGVVVGNELVAAFGATAEGPLTTQVRTGTAWSTATAVTGTNVCATAGGGGVSRCGGAPGLLATGGATVDVLAVHVDKATRLLSSSTRSATTKLFTSHGAILAGTTSDEEVFLAKVGATRAVLAFRGQNGLGYASLADLSVTPPTFSTPVALSTGALASVPRVATGICGDDAAAVFVTAAGAVRLVRLRGTTWGGEEAVGTVGVAKYAAIATRP